jgi:integrase/recombinase XerD
MLPRFDQFIRERKYLYNVTDRTVEWYENSLRWLPCEDPTQEQINATIVHMRERGLKETSVNTALRCVNAYLHWNTGTEGGCGTACQHPKGRRLKEPRSVLPTFTDTQVACLIKWKAQGRYDRRLHLLVLFLLDTGARISEALRLQVRELDFDNLLVTLDGKGRKQRIVPISLELRKAIFRYKAATDGLLFPTDSGGALSKRNVLRDVKALCKDLGFTAPARTVHAFRHTFAVNYLRRGGSVFHLQKVLGHSSLEMTRRYANLVTADLQAVHERVSLLAR